LENDKCPIHLGKTIELRAEENYFFRYSAFESQLLDLYEKNPDLVIPDFRFNEIRNFVRGGLRDFSISRLKSKMPWGIAVPGDKDHVMYVWFDALTSYISTLGWPDDEENFKKFWDGEHNIQFAGKDQVRQQAAMWQAMLLAAGLPSTHQVIIHGFLNLEGQKMSKSLGNTVNPVELVDEFGVEALRYFIARHINDFEDFDFSLEKMKEAYNANLANGLGNLVSRIMKMAATHLDEPVTVPEKSIPDNFKQALDNFEINQAANIVWEHIGELDKKIQITEPYKLVKTEPDKAKVIITELAVGLYTVGRMLNPLLPETSVTIKNLVKANEMPVAPLFARKD
ncbi:MAG: methionine--tRNA ligase, partial [Patescibacteria group bacterium]